MHGDDTVELVDIVTLAGRTTTTRLLIRRSAEIVDSNRTASAVRLVPVKTARLGYHSISFHH
jgi:hypothetical protein